MMSGPQVPASTTTQGRTIWVGGVEPWMNEAFISKAFGIVAAIDTVKVVRDKHSSFTPAGFAFIQFQEHAAAKAFVDRLDGNLFVSADGHRFKVNWAAYGIGEHKSSDVGASSIYVGNLDYHITDTQLLKVFTQRYSSAVSAKVSMDPHLNISRGYGFVRFRDAREAEEALVTMQGIQVAGKYMKIRRAEAYKRPTHFAGTKDFGAGPAAPPPPPNSAPTAPGHSIVIGGLYPGLSDYDVACQFGIFGCVYRAWANQERGVTVVEFRDRISAELAVQHLHEKTGVPAALADVCEHVRDANWGTGTREQAACQVQSYLKEQLDVVTSQPSKQHFHILLQDPLFVALFEEQLAAARGRSAAPWDAAAEAASAALLKMSWLLTDQPDLFAAQLDVNRMNGAAMPSVNSPGAFARGHFGLPESMRLAGLY